MQRLTMIRMALAGAAILVLGTGVGAQVTKGKTRPMTTKQLMSGLVKPQATVVGEAVNGTGPADEKAWTALATSAALLTESGYTMMEDGRCPDDVWAAACKTQQESGKTLLEKIQAKDLAGSKEAFGKLTSACKSCHTVHHKK